MPPGVETWGFVENLAAFATGQTAMTISWPPYGRWTAGFGTDEKALSWVPKSQVAGKVGYALPPGGHPELAAGFALSVASTSKQKEQAYLFIQWLNSEEISNQRVQLPYTLRDPFRDSHYTNKQYLSRWPDAKSAPGRGRREERGVHREVRRRERRQSAGILSDRRARRVSRRACCRGRGSRNGLATSSGT